MSNREEREKKLWIAVMLLLVVGIIGMSVYYLTDKTVEEKELEKAGFTTTEEDAFYKKVVTNNTLDDFYNAMGNNQDTEYEEYYLQKESLNFFELKMSYQNTVSRTLSFTADLKTDQVKYNYELSYKSSHLILEGNNTDNYNCNIVVRKNINDTDIQKQCDYIANELSIFLTRREEMLENETVKAILRSPMKEYVEE